jgi:2-keto-4-pentenoate hydratase
LNEPTAAAEAARDALSIARRLTAARAAGEALDAFPGPVPADLSESYAIQEAAIGLWPDEIAGWKIGKVPPDGQARFGVSRLVGPIFRAKVQGPVHAGTFPAIPGGFAAVEAEVLYRLGADAPAGKLSWTADEALGLVADMHIGAELAGSPLAAINALGPAVVVADFGNNAGLIVGPPIPGWRDRTAESLTCATIVNGVRVGEGSAANLEGGPADCLAFLLGHAAGRGRPLKAGTWVSTGQLTGIHDVKAGDTATIDFGPLGQVRCSVEPAQAQT